MTKSQAIKAIDSASVHRITSGQVVVDLQTAVKELLENSIDAGATNIEVRFKNYGLNSIEVLDNGSGIAEEDYDSIALKHHTSKLETFSDLTAVQTFGFRGEALSSLCALTEELSVCTATATTAPVGVNLVMHSSGKVKERSKVARTRGTTITLTKLFSPLPVRRKEFERNAKREFGKALALLNAYALVPCASPPGIRLTVSNQPEKGAKAVQIRTLGSPSCRDSVTSLWGTKALENIVDMDLQFQVEREKSALKRLQSVDADPVPVRVKGLISKFTVGCGRTGTDRQFFFINGRPCNMAKIQKVFNEVYRSFNANQAPFVVADFIIPTESYDVNVSPDKRTILLHSEGNLISALKATLESHFSPSRSTFDIGGTQNTTKAAPTQTLLSLGGRVSTAAAVKGRRSSEATIPASTSPSHSSDDDVEEISAPVTTTRSASSSIPRSRSDQAAPSPNTNTSTSTSTSPPLPARPSPTHSPSPTPASEPDDLDDVLPPSEPPIATLPEPAPSSDPGHMEVDHDHDHDYDHDEKDEEEEDAPVVVLDSSQTSWGRKLGLTPQSSRHATPPARPAHPGLDGEVDAEEDEEEEEAGAESARKKRKSNHGSVINLKDSFRRVDALEDDGKEDDEVDAAPAWKKRKSDVEATTTPKDKPRRVSTLDEDGQLSDEPMEDAIASISPVRPSGKGAAKRTPAEKARVGRVPKAPKLDLRSQLAGFARAGSQIALSSQAQARVSVFDEGEQEDEIEDEGDGSGVEEGQGGEVHDQEKRMEEADFVRPRTPEPRMSTTSQDVEPPTTPANTTPLFLPEDDDDTEDPSSILSQVRATSQSPRKVTRKDIERPEIIRTDKDGGDMTLRVDVGRIREAWVLKQKQRRDRGRVGVGRSEKVVPAPPSVPMDAGISNTEDEAGAVDALARVIEKKDFAEMEVIGQFNLGFIVVRRRQPRSGPPEDSSSPGSPPLQAGGGLDDLFIVDQHAADEKYNFETLQATTKIQSQKLFRPRSLELTASDEMIAIENVDVLRQNGFELDVDEEGSEGSSGSRLKLTAQPVSKSTVFDMKDLEEIIHLMRDRPSGQMVRCSKARSMFASRACRKSVMIGMPLNQHQMTAVIRHMGTMDQPWNCPHGRPTMRHLFDIREAGSRSTDRVDWSAIAA